MNSSTIKEVTNGLSELIYSTLQSLQVVQYHPGADSDMMDDEMKTAEERYTKLMRIRKEFELTCSMAIVKEKD
jgi:hypothetical protein